MSKKRRVYGKKRKRQRPVGSKFDKHHICYQGRLWKSGSLRELREFWYSIILIPRDTLHHQIHQEVTLVHPPKDINARGALNQLRLLEQHGAIKETDSLEKRLMLYIALFDCIEPETVKGFKKQLEIVRKFN